MADEYIEKEELIKKLCFETAEWYYSPTIKTIKEFPAADVQLVKHGRWIIIDDTEQFIAKCSICGRTEDSRCINDMPYCHCGVKMDGDKE